ncbi:MAG: hypothetical protein GY820_17015 [Gammaproteobacteria bacterium]|nr:hypothetical protein [Gammaproteobacteria bacterium]
MPTVEEIYATMERGVERSSNVADIYATMTKLDSTRTATSGSPDVPWSQRPENRERAVKLAEQEDLEEQWDVPFVLATGGASAYLQGLRGIPALGRTVHGLITMGTTAIGEYGVVKPVSKHAGRVHPYLEPLVGIVGGIGSAITLEALLSKVMIKALTKTAPKFWTSQLDLMKTQTTIPEKYLEDLKDLAARAESGDTEAAKELLLALNKEAYNNVKTAAEVKHAKLWADYRAKQLTGESAETVNREISESVAAKGHLDDVEYERLAKVAERDAINEYAEEFEKIRRSIVNERAAGEWAEHPSKAVVDHIIARGGVTEASIRKLFKGYTDEAVETIVGNIKKRFPKLLTEEEGEGLVKLAQELDQKDIRKMIGDIADSPGLSRIKRQKNAEFLNEFDRVYRDEMFIRIQEKTSSYLAKVLGIDELVLPPPGAPRKGFTIVGQAVKEIESGASVERVVQELSSVRQNIAKMTNIIRKNATSTATKKGRERFKRMQTRYAAEMSKYKTLVRIQKNTARIESRLKSVIQRRQILPEYKTQITNFLRPLFGGNRVRLDENMFQFLGRKYQEKLAFGADILANKYNDMIQTLGTRPFRFKDLTYAQIKDIDDFTKAFTFVARNEKSVVTQGNRMYVKAIAANIEATAQTAMSRFKMFRTRPNKNQLDALNEGSIPAIGRFTRASSDVASGMFAHLKRMEPILRQLDGFEEGLAHGLLFKPFVEAETMAHRLGDNVFDAYRSIFKVHQKAAYKGRRSSYWGKTVDTEVAGMRFTKETSVAMALNSKSPDNLDVLMSGLSRTKKEIDAYLAANLSEADWKLVNDIWDHLDNDLWPIISKIYKEMTGLNPKKVEGKYYPIHQDYGKTDRAPKLTDMLLEADPRKRMEQVELSFTRTRVGGSEHLKLTLDPLVKHLRDVVHTTTHWKAVSDAQKIIKSTRFKAAVENTMGTRIYDQFEPWLNNLARPFRTDPSNVMWEQGLRYLRGGTTIGVLGLVPSTAAKQGLSFITALPKIGVQNAVASVAKFGTNPIGFMRGVSEASPQMAYRVRTWQREIAEMASTIKPGTLGMPGPIRNAFFKFIHTVDRMTSSVVWHGAYIKGLEKFEGNAHRAVDFADSIVRHTQPASAAKDLPRIMRSGEGQRMISMFYSYFSVWHNQAAEIINRGLAGNMSIPKAASTLMFIAAAPIASWEMISMASKSATGRDVDVSELPGKIAKGSFMMATSGLPTIRDVAASSLLGYDFKLSPVSVVGKKGAETFEGIKTAFTDEEWERKHTSSAIEFAGYLSHLPSRQTVTLVEGALRLMNGETNDPTELLIKARKQ